MARGRPTSNAATAMVEAALMQGLTVAQAAKAAGVGLRTAAAIAASLPDRIEHIRQVNSQSEQVEGEKTIDQLVVEYLNKGFRAMIAQVELLSDPEYLSRQDADKLATVHGTIADKLAGVASTAQALGLTGPTQPALPDPGDVSPGLPGGH